MINNITGLGMSQAFASQGGFLNSGSYAAAGYQRHHKPILVPQLPELWCLPIYNFRIDGGKTNLFSQKVSLDWPEFRPQSPIFAGPSIRQDTTNLFARPAPSYNFDDCYRFGSCAIDTINQLLPGFHLANQQQFNFPPYIDPRFGSFPGQW